MRHNQKSLGLIGLPALPTLREHLHIDYQLGTSNGKRANPEQNFFDSFKKTRQTSFSCVITKIRGGNDTDNRPLIPDSGNVLCHFIRWITDQIGYDIGIQHIRRDNHIFTSFSGNKSSSISGKLSDLSGGSFFHSANKPISPTDPEAGSTMSLFPSRWTSALSPGNSNPTGIQTACPESL